MTASSHAYRELARAPKEWVHHHPALSMVYQYWVFINQLVTPARVVDIRGRLQEEDENVPHA